MAYSKIRICNMALGMLGESFIRSFNDNDTKTRMCQIHYDMVVDTTLSRFDWPFARAVATLNELSIQDDQKIDGKRFYAIPSNCNTPRYLLPEGSAQYFSVMGKAIVTDIECPKLVYTRNDTTEALFSPMFVHVLSLALAVRLAPALTQDKILTSSLKNLLEVELINAAEVEANSDNNHRYADEVPENDTFVNVN